MIKIGQWRSLLRLEPFLKENRLTLAAGIACVLLCSLLAAPIPYITGILLDKVLMGNRSYSHLCIYVGTMAGLYVLQHFISLISGSLFVKISNSVVNELKYSVMSKVLDLPLSFLSTTEKGYVQERISECSSVGNAFSPVIISMLLSVINAISAIIIMLTINSKMTLIVLLLTPVFYFFSKSSDKKFMKHMQNMMESAAVLGGETFEIINGIEDIKVLGCKGTHLSKFKAKMNELVYHNVKQNKSLITLTQNISLINNAFTILILLISGILILKGQFTIGLYTSFSLYVTRVTASTQSLTTLGTILKPVCLSIKRIYELLDMQDENSGRDIKLDSPIGRLEFRRVGFRYRNDLPEVLNRIDFTLKRGDKVLFQGENGSGKTTVIKLLLGLYSPTSGFIDINGSDASRINRDSLRQRMGIVSQSIFLFRGTVLDNILQGQEGQERETVESLICELGLQDYIGRMAKGLDTVIFQNSSGVSGGQAQIIAFIRAMLSQRDLLILDEPIANVDEETRNLIINILRKINYAGILIVISHQTEGMDFFEKVIRISKARTENSKTEPNSPPSEGQ